MIREALEFVCDQFSRSAQILVDQRPFVRAGQYHEVKPEQSPNKTHKFGTVVSLCDYLKQVVEEPSLTTTIVSPNGIQSFLNEEAIHRNDVLVVPFFRSDLPGEREMSYQDFLLYLDQHEGKVEDEANLRALLKLVKVRKEDSLLCEDRGAFVEFTAEAKRGTASAAENQAVQIPAKLVITLRVGTREYEEPHTFRLYGQVRDGLPVFRLVHIDRDQAVDRFMQRCIQDVRGHLGDGWHVYQGA